MNRTRSLLLGATLVHVGLSGVHGLVHVGVPVPVPDWQAAAAALTLVFAPVAGAALVVGERSRLGLWVLGLSGAAALGLEGALHLLVANPDHVSSVGRCGLPFAVTAALTTAGDALLVGAALAVGLRHRVRGAEAA